jgi:hypothetical protein
MIPSKSLPPRPSLESLRKQAKTLARDSAAGDAVAVARARAQLPRVDLPLSQRNAQRARTSTPGGTPMSRPASCTTWCSTGARSRCDS